MWTRLFAAVRTRSQGIAATFNRVAVLTIVLWVLYPIVFLLGTEGFGGVDQGFEIFLFLILDLLAKVGFGFLLLSNHQVIGEAGGGGGGGGTQTARVR